MRAAFMYGAGDVRVIDVPDPVIQQPTDAIVRVVRACICGSDLHPYHSMPVTPGGSSMGHEYIGVVEDTGDDVGSVKKGDLVIAPFAWSDGTCDYCLEGPQTSCRHGGFWNANGVGGGQAEAVRVPLADGTLVAAPVEEDSPLIPSLLTLSDVYGTGYHAAIRASVSPRTSVTVIGDGAVGLMAVLSAKRLGAERIILMGRHTARTDLGRDFGATDIVAERGEAGIEKVRDLAGGDGTHIVLEAVGFMAAYEQAIGVVRPGGVISRVGVPQYEDAPVGFGSLFGSNITLTGGPAPHPRLHRDPDARRPGWPRRPRPCLRLRSRPRPDSTGIQRHRHQAGPQGPRPPLKEENHQRCDNRQRLIQRQRARRVRERRSPLRSSAAHTGLGFGQSGLEFFRARAVDLGHRLLDGVGESVVDGAGAVDVVDGDDASRAGRQGRIHLRGDSAFKPVLVNLPSTAPAAAPAAVAARRLMHVATAHAPTVPGPAAAWPSTSPSAATRSPHRSWHPAGECVMASPVCSGLAVNRPHPVGGSDQVITSG
jgi:threonine dehydrogenase-like Zn-dependent dehydrogenase